MSNSKLVLGYWAMRGYGEPIRNLLRFVGADFEDVRYGFGRPPNYNWDEWLAVKPTLGLSFPNLPYLIDGELKMNQSQAILRYLAGKYHLRATNLADQALEDMLEGQIVDLRDRFVRSAYHKSYPTEADLQAELAALRTDLAHYLTELESYIGDRPWLTGTRLSFVDFIAYEYLDWYRDFVQPDCFANYPKMAEYMKRFEELPQLREHLASVEYRKAPILNPTRAKIGFR